MDFIAREIQREYQLRRDKALKDLEIRREEIYNLIPRIKEIDSEIFFLGLESGRLVLQGDDAEKESVILSKKMELLKEEKFSLLRQHKLEDDYLLPRYICSKCEDRGYLKVDDNWIKCTCYNQELIIMSSQEKTLFSTLDEENFSTFDETLFSDEIPPASKVSTRDNILRVKSRSLEFLENLENPKGKNLLFYGLTGLGKTFMCNCIAKEALERGFTVVYHRAFSLFELIRNYNFNPEKSNMTKEYFDLIYSCDLLILDDLWFENPSAFNLEQLFNILNIRLSRGKKILISTNHSLSELNEKYSSRIYSRIIDNFFPCRFIGTDLRLQKKLNRIKKNTP